MLALARERERIHEPRTVRLCVLSRFDAVAPGRPARAIREAASAFRALTPPDDPAESDCRCCDSAARLRHSRAWALATLETLAAAADDAPAAAVRLLERARDRLREIARIDARLERLARDASLELGVCD